MHRLILALLVASLGAQDLPIERAVEALSRDDFAAAVPLLQEAAEADPRNASIPFNLGYAFTQLGNDSDAIAAYRQALEIDPDLQQAFRNLGVLLLRNGSAAEAAPYLERALEDRPDDPIVQYFYGQALAASGHAEQAIGAFERAAALQPDEAAVWIELGSAQANLNRVDDALASYRKAAELDPALRTHQVALAEQIELAGGNERALEIYQDFLEAEPDYAAVRERVGMLLLEMERYAEAAEELERVVAESPTDASRAALAQAYSMANDAGAARAKWAEAVAANPNEPELRLRYGASLIHALEYEKAGEQYLAAVKQAPGNANAWTGLAFTLYQVDNFPASLEALARAEALAPLKPASIYLRAITQDRLQMHEEARASYQQFLSMNAGMEDEEWKSRQRLRVIALILDKK